MSFADIDKIQSNSIKPKWVNYSCGNYSCGAEALSGSTTFEALSGSTSFGVSFYQSTPNYKEEFNQIVQEWKDRKKYEEDMAKLEQFIQENKEVMYFDKKYKVCGLFKGDPINGRWKLERELRINLARRGENDEIDNIYLFVEELNLVESIK